MFLQLPAIVLFSAPVYDKHKTYNKDKTVCRVAELNLSCCTNDSNAFRQNGRHIFLLAGRFCIMFHFDKLSVTLYKAVSPNLSKAGLANMFILKLKPIK